MRLRAVYQLGALVGCCLLTSCSQTDAAMRDQSAKVANETKVEVLAGMLTNSVSSVRIAAARCLGELGSSTAIPYLLTAYNSLGKRKPGSTLMSRTAIIEALGQLQGKESRVVLQGMLATLVERGPQYRRHMHEDVVFLALGTALVRAIGPACWNTEVLQDLSKIMSDQKMPTTMRQEACSWILRGRMRDAALGTLDKKVAWLASQLESTGSGNKSDWVRGKSGVKTNRAIRDAAIMKLLRGFGPDARPLLKQGLADIREEKGLDYKDRKTEALELLLRQIPRR